MPDILTILIENYASLDPKRRQLLEKLLAQRGIALEEKVILPQPRDGSPFPLSFAQQRLWFLEQLEPNTALYNIPVAVRITGPLDLDALQRSLDAIVARHESLRTTFATRGGEPVQVIADEMHLPIQQVDLSDLDRAQQDARVQRLALEEAQKPFDLEKGPLVRFKLLRLGDEEHVALLTMHHIIADGWSMGVFINELGRFYDAFTRGSEPNLPPLRIQYPDYAVWQRKLLQGERLEQELAFWREQLGDGGSPPLELPLDHPRPPVTTFRGDHVHFEIPAAIAEKLVALAQEHEATPFMILLAAYDALLYRYTGQDDISVGTPEAGRGRKELEPLIGFFINTLVIRSFIPEEKPFTDFLAQVRDTVRAVFEHRELPFERIVEEIQPERDLSRSPLFQTLFTFQNAPTGKVRVTDLTFEPVDVTTGTVKFDLTLTLGGGAEGFHGAFGYNVDLFERTSIERMVRHFLVLLEDIVEHPERPISRLNILPEDERRRVLVDWTPAPTPFPADKLVHQLVEEQAARTPDCPAVIQPASGDRPQRVLTYAKLDARANQLAHALIARGVGPEDVVGISMARSPEMLVAMLGILKAGAAYLPLDPHYPEERLRYMMEDAGVRVVISDQYSVFSFQFSEEDGRSAEELNTEHLADASHTDIAFASAPAFQILHLDELNTEHYPDEKPAISLHPENLAYVIYTSGSTGQPKGVEIAHRNLVNYVTGAAEAFGMTPDDRMLQFASISFDAAGEEIYPTLIRGGALVLRTDEMLSSPEIFLQKVDEWGVTVLDLPTAYWHQVAADAILHRLPLPPSLRLVIIGGERALPERVRAWMHYAGHQVRLLNTYGPTETTIVATSWEARADFRGSEVPIGRAVQNVRAYIVDKHLQPVPIGVPGELVIGGEGVARGYHNRPHLTAEKFVPDPFVSENHEGTKTRRHEEEKELPPLQGSEATGGGGPGRGRLYRTGDKVRWLPNGDIQFLGRIDQQVKIRGYRIEPGEVEHRLAQHPALKQVVVVAREDTPGDRRLVAYIVPARKPGPSVNELRAFVKQTLPDYMAPAAFVELDELPLTVSGKVNVRALPAPDQDRPDLGSEYVAPRNPLEEALADMWKELLGVERVGIHDNFFDLGGDSLKAAIFVNRLQEFLGEIVYVVVLFDAPTIAELASYLIENFPAAVARSCKIELSELTAEMRARVELDEGLLADMRRQIEARGPDPESEKRFLATIRRKNPPAIFILTAPRSGSTLLRVMLAGNPALFSPPELALLPFRTLAERRAAFAGRESGWQEGVWRALMAIHDCDFETARDIMADLEARGMTIQDFYLYLQERIGDRLLVDKTTTNALHPLYLPRAEAYFENAFYIHLVRHPAAMIQSYLTSGMDQIFGHGYSYPPRAKAELFWNIVNQNILEFLENVPEERRFFLQYEDLVTNPEYEMRRLCDALGIDFHPDMLDPYGDPVARMTDPVHPESRMVGDPRFMQHRRIDPSLATKGIVLPPGDALSALTLELARKLDYHLASTGELAKPQALTAPAPISRDQRIPLSFAQQRLWFLDQLAPGQSLYHIPTAMRLQGQLNVEALERAVNAIIQRHEVLRTVFLADENGEPYQHILPELRIPLEITDLRHLPEDERMPEAERIVDEVVKRPFDLARGPLIRGQLIQLDDEDYVAVMVMHHTVSDGWSTGILVREIVAHYMHFAFGFPLQLPDLPIQYADYAWWQRQWLQGEVLEGQLDWWREYLAGAPPLLELPTDRPRPPVQTFNGGYERMALPPDLLDALKKLSREEGATLFMTLLTAFDLLLSRYARQEDIVIGTPIANRNRAELENLIGYFANTLVIRAQLHGNPTFREALQRVREAALGAYAHQDTPFEMVVNAVDAERNMSFSPLFQVMFILQNLPQDRSALKLPGLTLDTVHSDTGVATFDITFALSESPGGLRGALNYNTDLFDAATIRRMLNHFARILEQVVADPDRPIGDISLLTEEEARLLLVDWNRTEAPFPADATIPQRFMAQTAATPDAPAVVFGDTTLTYAELDARSNQVAHALIARGVGPESLVGLMLPRSAEMMVALLGILKAGGAYVPLDPNYPPERLRYMIEDAGVEIVISNQYSVFSFQFSEEDGRSVDELNTEHLTGAFQNDAASTSALAFQILYLDELNTEHWPIAPPNIPLHPENAAYVIYTSGSTGRPKGVVIPHRNALNLAAALKSRIYDQVVPGRALRISLNAPLSFDASVQQWIMLTYGHTLVIVPDEVRRDGAALVDFIRAQRLELVDCVPTQLKLMIEHGLFDEDAWKPLAMLPGGEAIDQATWDALRAQDAIQFFNMYGPTECTVDSVVSWVNRSGDRPNIGRFLANDRGYVLDAYGQPAPIGVPGELYLGGAGVARGYLNRPALTAERFLPDPFIALLNHEGTKARRHEEEKELPPLQRSEATGGGGPGRGLRLYRTGDLVRWLPSGELEFLGRVDFQVKFHGYRIELGEIESVLREHGAIKDVVVMVREDTPGAQRLVAYLIPEGEARPSIDELRKFAGQSLPDYMIPGVFVYLDAFPLLPNGKINRRALPEPEVSREDLGVDYAPPSTPEEEALVEIWTEVLGVDQVGVYDNFFELGGDSILSIQVVARANQRGLNISPKDIFQNPTIAGLAAVAAVSRRTIVAEQGEVTGDAPLTPIQQWFFERDFEDKHHWNQSLMFQLTQALDREALAEALRALLAHHDALRLRFVREGDAWRQVFAPMTSQDPLHWFDLSHMPDDAVAEAIQARAAELQASIDLDAGQLFHAGYFHLGGERPPRLLLIVHHLAVDGVSWRILLEDLQMAYLAASSGRSIDLPPKTTSFKYWAERLAEYAASPEVTRELDTWLRLGNEFFYPLPADEPYGENTEASVAQVAVSLSAEETEALLKEVPNAYRTHIDEILLAALARTLFEWTYDPRVLVHLEGHGRMDVFDEVDHSRTVGWFTNMYPVLLDIGAAGDDRSLILAVKEQMRAIPDEGFSYGLLRYLNPETSAQMVSLPEPEIAFNYLGQFDQALPENALFRPAAEGKGPDRSPNAKRPFLIGVNGGVMGGKLSLQWSYSRNIHHRETIQRLAEDYMRNLRTLIAHCLSPEAGGVSASDFDLAGLSQRELDKVLRKLK